MPEKIKEMQSPGGLLRLLFRLPIWLYKAHLGWLAGNRFLLLHHTGRKSGLPRQAIIEVLQYDKNCDSYSVLAAFGEKTEWLRNVEQAPRVIIDVGHRRLHVLAKRLPPEQAEQKVLDYARRHPIARRLMPQIMGYRVDGTEQDFRALARLGIVVTFSPVSPAQELKA